MLYLNLSKGAAAVVEWTTDISHVKMSQNKFEMFDQRFQGKWK